MDLFSEIKSVIIKEFAVDDQAVTPEAHLQDDLGADSLALLNLTEIVGKRYDIEITGDDMVEVNSVSELVELIKSRIASK
jgi:acyl carrier protein